MTAVLMVRRERLVALCRKCRVRRLDVFGSAARMTCGTFFGAQRQLARRQKEQWA